MFELGITELHNIITDEERFKIIKIMDSSTLNDESKEQYYKNSVGNSIDVDDIHNRLTNIVENVTGLNITKDYVYSRIYRNDSYLKPHTDREGLDLVLSIQLKNTFNCSQPIFAKGYDGTIYESNLKNGNGVLMKGRELEHWRNEIIGDGELYCVFFFWKINVD